MNIVKDIRREAERDPPAPPPRKRMKNNSVGARSRSVRGSQALLARVFFNLCRRRRFFKQPAF